MLRLLIQIYGHLSPRRKTQFFMVLALMLAGTVAEVFTLGAIVPFLGLLVNPGMADQQPLVAAALDALAPWVGGSRLAAASIWFAFFAVSSAILRHALNWASVKFVFSVCTDLGVEIYSRILQQPYSYHTNNNSSTTIAAVEKVGTVAMGMLAPLMQASIALVMVCAILSAMFWLNPQIALIAGSIFSSLYLIISYLAKRSLTLNSKAIADCAPKRIKVLQEGLGAIRDLIIDGNSKIYVNQFAYEDKIQRAAQGQNLVLASSPKYIVESLGMVLFAGLAFWLSTQPDGVSQAIPTLGALALGAQRLLPYMQNIYNGFASSRGTLTAATETLQLLQLPVQKFSNNTDSINTGFDYTDSTPLIQLKDLSFSYADHGPSILDNVTLAIQKGSRVGFVGKTGSGKSTLVDIIMGLLSPISGKFFINGQLVTPENIRYWQAKIAHVPQSIYLTDSSLAENIAFGTPRSEIDHARLDSAILQAQLKDVVEQLPKGIETHIGERGVQLSGGQRQRLGIARALYKKAEVLIFDEATSALDSLTESKIMNAIYELNPSITILIIAHRVSTLNQCDIIFEISGGNATTTNS